ncbi:MAG: hypothetical protein EOP11_17785 [Proteobacteria bacterium]|nr:MAG: hypothetical protein EOP11_17785 [Pseudomonadota bacterium]
MTFAKSILLLALAACPTLSFADDIHQRLVETDLFALQRAETRGKNPEQVEEMNRQSFINLPGEIPEETVHAEDMAALIHSYRYHPVIGPKAVEQYQQTGVSIGYCFGRAYYFHMALKKLGVSDVAIKKAWIVGKIGENWQFHVATMVRSSDGDWWVMDTNSGAWAQGIKIKDWYLYWKRNSSSRTRIYFTDAEKFTPGLGAYDPVQLGYGLDRNKDWYKNYFVDLDTWFKSSSSMRFFNKLGLYSVR